MKYLFFLFPLFSIYLVNAQDNKTVTLVVSGQGKTQDEAKQNALRSAIEQAFGAFISSKTEILNDDLVRDEIVSVSNGNIQKYEVISEVKIPDGGFATSLQATVSVTKLTSFVESKGIESEFKGSLFALNIQNQELASKNELVCLENLKNILSPLSLASFDYKLDVYDPKKSNLSNQLFDVPIKVTCIANDNLKNWVSLFESTIQQLAMPKSEIENYLDVNKQTYKYKILKGNKEHILCFRNEGSLVVLNEIFATILAGIQNFKISNNINEFDLTRFSSRKRLDPEIQQTEQNYLMTEFNYVNLQRRGPNYFDGCIPCIYEKDSFYLINRGSALSGYTSMKNEISFNEILSLVGRVVSIYQFNDSVDLEALKRITKYEIKSKK